MLTPLRALDWSAATWLFAGAFVSGLVVWLWLLKGFLEDRCPYCGGLGRYRERLPFERYASWRACLACAGRGKLDRAPDHLPAWLALEDTEGSRREERRER